jgi:hypothetical protein
MSKMRSGVEIPIIPEDFVDSEEELDLDMMESYLQWAYNCFQDGSDPADRPFRKLSLTGARKDSWFLGVQKLPWGSAGAVDGFMARHKSIASKRRFYDLHDSHETEKDQNSYKICRFLAADLNRPDRMQSTPLKLPHGGRGQPELPAPAAFRKAPDAIFLPAGSFVIAERLSERRRDP